MRHLKQRGMLLNPFRFSSGAPQIQFAKWDSNFKSSLISLSDNDLSAYRDGGGTSIGIPYAGVRADVGLSSGRWYFEISSSRPSYSGNGCESAGICSDALDLVNVSGPDSYIGVKAHSYGHCYRRNGGGSNGVQEVRNNVSEFGGTIKKTDGVVGIAVDLDAGKAWAIINGAWFQGARPTSAPGGRYTFPVGTKMYPAITIQDGISTVPAAVHTLNSGKSPFAAVIDAEFLPGGSLAGFNKGWWSQ